MKFFCKLPCSSTSHLLVSEPEEKEEPKKIGERQRNQKWEKSI
jgi:hypothetical protein